MITTSEELADFLGALRGAGRIALDTEADSLHCYFEKLCLIQISIPGMDVLIDPLCDFPLEPLFDELRRHEIILQGLDYDLRLLRRSGLEETGEIFDTMIAARLTGTLEFSLAALLKQHFDITLAKGSQKANWARRPLPPTMEEYARNDTRYLLPLAERLGAELHRLGRWEWFLQSCRKAREATRIQRERDPDTLWRISGSGELRGLASALLRALWFWRDEEARAVDRPPFHIARNDLLIDAARRIATGETVELPHLSSSRRKRYHAAVEAALALPQEQWPKAIRSARVRATPENEKRFAALKKTRDAAAQKHGLEASLIAPKNVLEALAADLEGNRCRLLPWQEMLLGLEP